MTLDIGLSCAGIRLYGVARTEDRESPINWKVSFEGLYARSLASWIIESPSNRPFHSNMSTDRVHDDILEVDPIILPSLNVEF